MDDDRRKEKRIGMQRICWIVTAEGSNRKQCQVRDVSDQGAKITTDNAEKVPDVFILLLSEIGSAARKCKVVRRTEKELGVKFLAKVYRKPAEVTVVDDLASPA